VRQKETLKFLDESGGWVVAFEEARTFESTWKAVDTCMKQEVHGAEIVMRITAPLYDIVIDVL
jgi:hypothetical protein